MSQVIHKYLIGINSVRAGAIDDEERELRVHRFSVRDKWITDTHQHGIAPCRLTRPSTERQRQGERKLYDTIVGSITVGPNLHNLVPSVRILLPYLCRFALCVVNSNPHFRWNLFKTNNVINYEMVTCHQLLQ